MERESERELAFMLEREREILRRQGKTVLMAVPDSQHKIRPFFFSLHSTDEAHFGSPTQTETFETLVETIRSRCSTTRNNKTGSERQSFVRTERGNFFVSSMFPLKHTDQLSLFKYSCQPMGHISKVKFTKAAIKCKLPHYK